MPSIVTSIIGGIQGASAAHNAANALTTAYNNAGQTVNNAVSSVNPGITSAAGTAAGNITTAGTAAANGVLTTANQATGTLSPYTTTGSTAANQLATALAPGGTLNTPFTASTMAQMDPGFQFRLAQGQNALTRQLAASGLSGSGGGLKQAQQYGQNFASSEYNNAFQQYLSQNQALANNLLAASGQGQQATEFGAQLNTGASEYAGNMGFQTATTANNLNYNAALTTANNTLSAANYLANTQVGAGQATAQGDVNAANAWNGMLGGVGTAANALAIGGLGTAPGGGTTWSPSNVPGNLGFGGGH